MRITGKTFSAFLLALLGTLLLTAVSARADEGCSGAVFSAPTHHDIVTDELEKRQRVESHSAVHRTAETPSPQTARTDHRHAHRDFARAASAELVFLGLAELRPDFRPPEDARAPEPPDFALPPPRSPPAR